MPAPLNTWIHLGEYLRIKHVTDTDAMMFFFRHIRPLSDFTTLTGDGSIMKISRLEPSVILGKTNPNTRHFHCAKAKPGGMVDPMELHSAADAVKMASSFVFWDIPFETLVQSGQWEVWNGPNPIIFWHDTVNGPKAGNRV